jgi:hypothetical protein
MIPERRAARQITRQAEVGRLEGDSWWALRTTRCFERRHAPLFQFGNTRAPRQLLRRLHSRLARPNCPRPRAGPRIPIEPSMPRDRLLSRPLPLLRRQPHKGSETWRQHRRVIARPDIVETAHGGHQGDVLIPVTFLEACSVYGPMSGWRVIRDLASNPLKQRIW